MPKISVDMAVRIDQGIEEAAQMIAKEARDRVPVESGTLQRAIHVERRGPLSQAVVAGNTEAFYGHMVEFGTTHSAAHPFAIPAYELSKTAAVGMINALLRGL